MKPKKFENEAIVSRAESRVQITRSDVARLHRATQDIDRHINRSTQNIDGMLRENRHIDPNTLTTLVMERNRLNDLHSESERLKKSLMKNAPLGSNASFTDREKKELKSLYESGLYTQKELAQQYGVSQSAISQTTKKSDE